MCGVVGTYGHVLSRAEFGRAVSALAHRGPDADGVFFDQHGDTAIWLGHRRLSIIDLSESANQPLRKGNLAIAYNGEIYNYQALRDDLASHGVEFRTCSDTEVVLEGWRFWGTGLFERLRGMFAFAIYDRATGELILARDHLGIKPMFVFHEARSRRVAFASELKALRCIPGVALALDPTALAASLLYDWIPEQQCIYAGVSKLAPGSFMVFGPGGKVTTKIYWRPEDVLDAGSGPCSIDELANVLEDAVRSHLVADVDIAVMLSGGLDSSLITAIAAKHRQQLTCYTVGFRAQDHRLEAMPNDLLYARRLAHHLGLVLHEIEVTPDVASILPRMVEILDEPIGDAAAINVLLLSEAARARGIKVMLSGMGADEIFGGYRRHQACLLAARYRHLPRVLRSSIGAFVNRLPVASASRGYRLVRWAKRFLSFADHGEEAAYRRSYTYYDINALQELLNDRANDAIEDLRRIHADIYWRSNRDNTRDAQIQRMCMTDLQMFLPGLNLTYTDRASMAASVEVRVPFLDRKVVEAAFRLPGQDRIRRGVQKTALKKVAERWIPREMVYRPKAAFGMPLRAWTTRDLREVINDLLPSGHLVAHGYLSGPGVKALIQRNESGEQDHAQAIWQLLTLEYWIRAHQESVRH